MSHTNLRTINSTELNNSGPFRVGDRLTSGTAGQVLKSRGRDLSPEWDTDTDTTYQGSATINIDTTTDPDTINCIKVPHDLTITDSAGSSVVFDGSSTQSITINDNDNQLNLIEGNGIDITNGAGFNRIIAVRTDEDTIDFDGSELAVLKVPNTLTFTGYDTGTFDGSSALSINLVDNDNQLNLIEGNGIDITNGAGFNRIIAVRTDEDTIDFDGPELAVLKVPHTLTFTGYDTGTFDGSSNLTINLVDNDNQLNLTGALPMVINNGGGFNREVELQFNNITLGAGGGALEVLRVPNNLTAGTNITFSSGTTYDGSSAVTINATDTDTTYQGGTGISIDTTTNPDTINCASIPNTALQNSTISGVQLGSNLANLTFYASDGAFITSYNGANPPTSVILPAAGSTYQGGDNITIDTSTTPDTIDLDASLTSMEDITFVSAPVSTTLKGNDYPLSKTTCSYLDLSDTTNYIAGGVIATKVQRSVLIRSYTTTYSEFSSNFRTSFKAQSTNVMVEFRAIIRADNKLFYGGLYDYVNSTWNTDTRNRSNYNDQYDQDYTAITWWMRNLTPGNTYYISPYFRGSSGKVYMYTGHGGNTDGYSPAVMRIYDGGNNVNVY